MRINGSIRRLHSDWPDLVRVGGSHQFWPISERLIHVCTARTSKATSPIVKVISTVGLGGEFTGLLQQQNREKVT